MYYNRTLENMESVLVPGGSLRWLFDFVKEHEELDFQVGRNKTDEWISVYRGLSRLIRLSLYKDGSIRIDADETYRKLEPALFGRFDSTQHLSENLSALLKKVAERIQFKKHYDNRKEGYFQNQLSRKYGICGTPEDIMAIVDKEAVIGYKDEAEKAIEFSPLQAPFKELQQKISEWNPLFGSKNSEKSLGGELDFIALDRTGNVLLIEYKHGTNTSGIYLAPLQIGLYHELFSTLPGKIFSDTIIEMALQRQRMGLIHPEWPVPETIKKIVPVLIISEYNKLSTAKQKFSEILTFCSSQHKSAFLDGIQTYNYTKDVGLHEW